MKNKFLKSMVFVIACFIVAILSVSAYAGTKIFNVTPDAKTLFEGRWAHTLVATEEFEVYFEPASFEYNDDGGLEVWELQRYLKPDKKTKISRVITKMEYNNNRFKILHITSYDKKGRVVSSHSYSQNEIEWVDIVPGSIAETKLVTYAYAIKKVYGDLDQQKK
ncbi:MAG: hypothetical protein MJ048_02730 [Acidaminococcaceae bacterium]|nr:hypothetical protein [Acidaminococcaceae bacterium]